MITKEQVVDKVREYKGHVLGLEDKIEDVKIIGVSSGESNIVFFVDVNNLPYLVKVNGVGGKGVSFFRAEYEKLRSLGKYRIAPKAFVYDEYSFSLPFMILERYEGRVLRPNESEKKADELTSILNKLTEIPTSEIRNSEGFRRKIKNCKDYVEIFPKHANNQLVEYERRIGKDKIYKMVKKAHDNSRSLIENSFDSFEESELGLIHTGIHPKNIILTPANDLRLIDWEHSGVGDRAFEISSLFRSNPFSPEKRGEILRIYRGKTGKFEQRVDLYNELFKIHEVLWHAIRVDKAGRGKIQLAGSKNESYYQTLLKGHIENLLKSKLVN